jgi:hypothetical protein
MRPIHGIYGLLLIFFSIYLLSALVAVSVIILFDGSLLTSNISSLVVTSLTTKL